MVFFKLVLTPALTFYPLPQERKLPVDDSGFADETPANHGAGFSKRRRMIPPLRQRELEEGRGEVACEPNIL